MSKEKTVPLFATFNDMSEGFNKMLEIAETIEDTDVRIDMIVCYGCLIETFNETMREIVNDIETGSLSNCCEVA